MYTKLEIAIIFKSVNTYDELHAACEAFCFLIEEKYIETSNFLQQASQLAFRRIEKIDNYGNQDY